MTVSCSDNHRSLWSIISTCLLTIFACVYTSIHPNVPSPYDGPLAILRRTAGIMLATVLAPELMVIWAARQFLTARRFTQKMRDYETWNHAHSFYVYMGGFMRYQDGKPYVIVEPEDMLEAVKDGSLNPAHVKLTELEITDASKGKFISKGLTVLQVTWFCVQLIARRSYDLAITPLEIGTTGFAVLCCITYALWWDKPLNVNHPRRLEWTAEAGVQDNSAIEHESVLMI
ncbi:hypothetical protein CONPUDRAFT_64356 [Coniophora puteana RWD-64-598 SS2]|uniref:Uncharacterized protein n=1 Tax=Coniophora puteana (strain RWD-64-598) TaxID=741705 RepID=A0A5M3MBX7_CONPW|nr:uncharacterized protein CONPUDRAFT_64356 [Coniophora puteana RWD-64-598 SS2]EIW76516.1 hypothetical protein CONPUDRAFT_64356 [Coniophora puteana RWD-64-598 SS2]